MAETQTKTVQDFRAKIAGTDQLLFVSILSFLEDLKYLPQTGRSKTSGLVFQNKELKERIAKLTVPGDGRLHFHTKFYAAKPYPPKYTDSLRYLHDNYDENYWRCRCESCGNCRGEPQRYIYETSDGKKDFFCGSYLYEIRNISSNDIHIITRALTEQHRYFCHQRTKE